MRASAPRKVWSYTRISHFATHAPSNSAVVRPRGAVAQLLRQHATRFSHTVQISYRARKVSQKNGKVGARPARRPDRKRFLKGGEEVPPSLIRSGASRGGDCDGPSPPSASTGRAPGPTGPRIGTGAGITRSTSIGLAGSRGGGTSPG